MHKVALLAVAVPLFLLTITVGFIVMLIDRSVVA